MATNPEELIRKLLAMAQGGTEHEAALAAQRANELALKYNIDLSKIKDKPDSKAIQEQFDIKSEQWISNIIAGVCLVNAVKYYRHWKNDGWSYTFVGKAHNVHIAKSIASYLMTEVKRLNTIAVKTKEHLADPESRGAYRKAFRLAASQRLYSRLQAQYDELREDDDQALRITGSRALVVANYFDEAMSEAEALIKEKVGELLPSKTRGITVKSDEGVCDGAAAGNKISLAKQVDHATVQSGRLTRS